MMPSLVIAHAARVAFGLNRRTPPGAGSRQTDMNQQIASISALLRTSSRALARLMQRSPLSMATLAQKTPMICPRHSVFGRSLLKLVYELHGASTLFSNKRTRAAFFSLEGARSEAESARDPSRDTADSSSCGPREATSLSRLFLRPFDIERPKRH